MSYQAPVKDMLFNIQHLAGLETLTRSQSPPSPTSAWIPPPPCWRSAPS